ncbi:hypothetical protein Zmor_009635 [Zophobas morio]|uniref:Uncharacterized protein n=1 Tax=Zophobas morio TaxID=2755281 RepID=A0AA38IMQ4_9CUCU|nr:hypothetical protein Zmor_009635 [Zophobas morio]
MRWRRPSAAPDCPLTFCRPRKSQNVSKPSTRFDFFHLRVVRAAHLDLRLHLDKSSTKNSRAFSEFIHGRNGVLEIRSPELARHPSPGIPRKIATSLHFRNEGTT